MRAERVKGCHTFCSHLHYQSHTHMYTVSCTLCAYYFWYYLLVYFCELYLNYVIIITILKRTHTHTR